MTRSLQIAIDGNSFDAEHASASMRRAGHTHLVTQNDNPDAIVTACPQTAVDAIRSNRYVLMLNPHLCPIETRNELADSGLATPGNPGRFEPSITEVKRALDDGSIGQLGLLRVHSWSSKLHMPAALYRELDLAIWMSNELPTSVCAVESGTSLQIHLGFESDAMALIDLDHGIPSQNHYYSMSAIGDRGAAYSDDHYNSQLLLVTGGPRALLSRGSHGLPGMLESFIHDRLEHRDSAALWLAVEQTMQIAQRVNSSVSGAQVVHVENDHV